MVYLAFMSGAGFPEGATIAPVRPTYYVMDETDEIATLQAINPEGKYSEIKGCWISTKFVGEVSGIGITAFEGEEDEN
jgi:hypothetical protein